MTPISVCAKQNPEVVKMSLCPYVLFFEPGILRCWPNLNIFQNFSRSIKHIEIIIGANLTSILTGTFQRKCRKNVLKEGLPYALHISEVHHN